MVPLNVAQDALVRGGLAARVVLGLQSVDRDHELQVRQRGPRYRDRAERAGHNLNVTTRDQLRQQDLEFTVSDEGVPSDNRQVERVMLSDHV